MANWGVGVGGWAERENSSEQRIGGRSKKEKAKGKGGPAKTSNRIVIRD